MQICRESMLGAGIFDGDYALVDPAREAVDQDIVLAYVCGGGEPTVKRLRILDGRMVVVSGNPDYASFVTHRNFDEFMSSKFYYRGS